MWRDSIAACGIATALLPVDPGDRPLTQAKLPAQHGGVEGEDEHDQADRDDSQHQTLATFGDVPEIERDLDQAVAGDDDERRTEQPSPDDVLWV